MVTSIPIIGQMKISSLYSDGAVADPIPGTFLGGSLDIQAGDELIIDPFVLQFRIRGDARDQNDDPTLDGPLARLDVVHGPGLTQSSYSIPGTGLTLGRSETRDVVIPEALEDAMSRQAQAERERQSWIILSIAEEEIAESFAKASEHYRRNQAALHLRAMNMVFEGLKQKGSMIIVPSTAVETMGLGAMGGLTAFDRIFGNGAAEAPLASV